MGYGVDNVWTSEMCLHHGDLISHTKAEKEEKKFLSYTTNRP